MISARMFARSFSSFWAELLPLLTPSFVHMVNEGFQWDLMDRLGTSGAGPVPKMSDVSDPATIAEFAFNLAKLAIENELSVRSAFLNDEIRMSAVRRAVAIVDAYDQYQGSNPALLTKVEEEEGLALATNYEYFIDGCYHSDRVKFFPSIPGAGFISSCEADISIGDSLFEVKTVDRNLAGKDIRQLMVYLALQAATGDRIWHRCGFFNPRKATFHEFRVDELVFRMSGGGSASEVFREVVEFASSREIQLDALF